MNSEFLKKLVNDYAINDNTYSAIVTAIQNARLLNGRDKETNALKNSVLFNQDKEYVMQTGILFIGLINYLLVLDMLGSIFKKIGFREKEQPNENSITYILEQFGTDLCKKKRDTIKALRNCLAHNYSLLSIPDRRSNVEKEVEVVKNELHAFSICWTKQPNLITYPDESNRLTRDNCFDEIKHHTEICAESLVELIEGVYGQIKTGVNEGSVISNLSENELKSRFTYSH